MNAGVNEALSINSNSFSKPAPGKTMLSLLRSYGSDLHNAYVVLVEELQSLDLRKYDDSWMTKILLFRFSQQDVSILYDNKASLIGLSLIMNWVCGRILNELPANASLVDAEVWFQKSPRAELISNELKAEKQDLVLRYLNEIKLESILEAMPYLSEVFETGNETALQKGSKRKNKKYSGIFYTPTDIIKFIVTHAIENRKEAGTTIEKLTWLDPAIGTGAFVLLVLKHFRSISADNEGLSPLKYFQSSLFGTDISPFALQSACYIIATECLSGTQNAGLKEHAKVVGSNLAMIDATTIGNKKS